MRRLQRPRLTSSSFAASTSMCQFERNSDCSSSKNDRWMKAQRSWRNKCAYMLAGEGAMLVLWLSLLALFHTLVDRTKNLKVRLAEGKLARLSGVGPSFEFVDPVEKFTHGGRVATGSLRRELHRRCLNVRYPSRLTSYGRAYFMACGLHNDGSKISRTLRPTLWVTADALAKLRGPGWITAADLL